MDRTPWPDASRGWLIAGLLALASVVSQFDRTVVNLTVEPIKTRRATVIKTASDGYQNALDGYQNSQSRLSPVITKQQQRTTRRNNKYEQQPRHR